MELVRDGVVEELKDRLAEFLPRGVALVVGDVFMHHAPQPLDRVEVRTVDRNCEEFHPPFRA